MKRLSIGALVILLFLVTLVFTTACSVSVEPGNIKDDKKMVEEEIQLLHDRFNSGQYEEIYDHTSQNFKQAQTKDSFIEVTKQINNQLGKFIKVKDKHLNVVMGAPVQYRVIYVSEFEKTDVTEWFSFNKVGKQVQLVLFRADPGAISLDNLPQDKFSAPNESNKQ